MLEERVMGFSLYAWRRERVMVSSLYAVRRERVKGYWFQSGGGGGGLNG
jgi:hypothetical protein